MHCSVHIGGYQCCMKAGVVPVSLCSLICVCHQFRKESRAAGADGGTQRAAEDWEEAAAGEVQGCTSQEHHTAAGTKGSYHILHDVNDQCSSRVQWTCAGSASLTLPWLPYCLLSNQCWSDWLIDWSIGWLTDRLIDWLTSHWQKIKEQHFW